MALQFPSNPSLNQVYTDTVSGFTFQWNGYSWISNYISATVPLTSIPNNSVSPISLTTGGPVWDAIGDLSVSGILTATNGPVLIGTATSNGIASQRLQVTGGASFTGVGASVGIGTTRPQTALQVQGDLTVSGSVINSGVTAFSIAMGM
jgi:hypothetical protein